MMFTVMYFIVLSFNTAMKSMSYDMAVVHTIQSARASVFIMFFLLFTSGSYIFSNMKTKQQRLMFKLMPASSIEKFLVRYIYVILLWAVGCVIAFIIADILNTLLSLITGHGTQIMATPYFFSSFYDILSDISSAGKEFILSAELYLFGHSLYLLGGAVFRRHQFVLTSTALILGMIILSWIMSIFIIDHFDFNISEESLKGTAYFIMALLPVLIAVDYWLTFFIFKRMQVVNNKWLNL